MQDLGDSHRPERSNPIGYGRARYKRHELVLPRAPGGRKGRAVRRLNGKEPRPRAYRAGPFELGEATIETEDIAAISCRHENIVGCAESELFPELEGQSLGALDKERLPIVAGIKAFSRCGERRI